MFDFQTDFFKNFLEFLGKEWNNCVKRMFPWKRHSPIHLTDLNLPHPLGHNLAHLEWDQLAQGQQMGPDQHLFDAHFRYLVSIKLTWSVRLSVLQIRNIFRLFLPWFKKWIKH